MKAFHFPLQTVMDWRDQKAEQDQSELRRMHGVKADVVREGEQLRDEIHTAHQAMNSGPVASHDLLQLAKYVDSLHNRGKENKLQLEQCDRSIEQQRLKCLESNRSFRLLELCRDRRMTAWQRDVRAENEATAASSHLAKWVRESRAE